MVDWVRIRHDFPVTQGTAYFMSAAMSPMPTPVLMQVMHEYTRISEAGDIHWYEDLQGFQRLKRTIGEMIQASPDDLTIVANTSTAMSLIALTFRHQVSKAFHLVSMQEEFPATTVPFEYQGIPMRYVQPDTGRYRIPAILEQVDDETLAVVTSYVQYATGFRQDLQALGTELKKRGVMLIVNATQAFPFYPIDMQAMGIDVLAASLHKWGFAGHLGSLFVTSSAFRERYEAPMAGWLSLDTGHEPSIPTAKGEPLKLHTTADRYNLGHANLQIFKALETALNYVQQIGEERIRLRIKELSDYLIAGLQVRGVTIISPIASVEERSAIIAFDMGESVRAFVTFLEDRDVFVSLRNDHVRVAINIFNNFEDIDRLLDGIDQFHSGQSSPTGR